MTKLADYFLMLSNSHLLDWIMRSMQQSDSTRDSPAKYSTTKSSEYSGDKLDDSWNRGAKHINFTANNEHHANTCGISSTQGMFRIIICFELCTYLLQISLL